VTGPGRRIELKTVRKDVSRFIESDLAWAPTHTLTNPFTEVVDHSAATSILAAGSSDAVMTAWLRKPTRGAEQRAIGHGVAVRQRFSALTGAPTSRRRSTITIGGGRSRRRPKPEPAQAAVHLDHREFAGPARRAQGGKSR
jgi:hypothetical protein